MDYSEFINKKSLVAKAVGFTAPSVNDHCKPHQKAIIEWACKRGKAAIFADTGMGKQHPVDEPILTPDGWDEIGNISEGDYVVGVNGKKTKVTGVYPQGEREIVKVSFNDGTFSLVGWDHLWSVRTKTMKYKGQGYRTMDTKEIADSIHRDWQIPICDPVNFNGVKDSDLPMDSYFLGVLLGDGSITHGCPSITTDEEIINSFIDGGFKGKKLDQHSDGIAFFRFHGLIDLMKEMNLHGKGSHEKHIPNEYMTASIESRIGLIQGLLDSDGYPMKDGGIEYCTTSQILMDGFCDLVRSVGGIARNCISRITKCNGKNGRRSWRVNCKFPDEINPFRLTRKAEKYVRPTKYKPTKVIRSVESCGYYQEAVCISVEADDSLYLTRDYIVTHNTIMQLEWARLVNQHTGLPVLLLAPLAVGKQTESEAHKFHIDAHTSYVRELSEAVDIQIANYEMIHVFNPDAFGGIVLDESSILKGKGAYFKQLCAFSRNIPYRLSCTATPGPNDYMELGTQSEFLGVMNESEMLATFFIHDGSETQKWRLKGHGATKFWEWLATWAVVISSPSDLGFDGSEYDLPTLNIEVVKTPATMQDGMLPKQAMGLTEARKSLKLSMQSRCEAVAKWVNSLDEPCLIWGEYNDECDLLESLIDDCAQVAGRHKEEQKEDRLLGFSSGKYQRLVSKGKIAGWGMNWQNCNKMAFSGPTYKFEQFYQSVRRCWRFGQTKPVTVKVFMSESEEGIHQAMIQKMEQDKIMRAEMIKVMADAMKKEIFGATATKSDYAPCSFDMPAFL